MGQSNRRKKKRTTRTSRKERTRTKTNKKERKKGKDRRGRTRRKKEKRSSNVKEIKKQQNRAIKYLAIGFLVLFGLCYRNSQIDENFAKVQETKEKLAEVQKQNTQLEISIESGLNLNNLEQEAKEKLGMQKLNSKQTTYITLPKTDYIEPATEQVVIEEEQSRNTRHNKYN